MIWQAVESHRRFSFSWLRAGERLPQPIQRFPVFYSSLPDIGAGFRPVEAEDSYGAKQIVQREYPGAITASLSENMTDEKEVRRLFVEWLKTL